MNFPMLLVFGFIAGGTILIGLPIGRFKGFNPTLRASLSMFAAGILVFLLVEILGGACGQTASALRDFTANPVSALLLVLLLVIGFFFGFVGLVSVEQKLI